jgi:putative addiction module component (TIGR02574 family)
MKAKVKKKPKRVSKLKVALDAAKELTARDKRKLIDRIADDLEKDELPYGLTEAHMRELDRRAAEYEANPGIARPWTEVRDELRAKYGF